MKISSELPPAVKHLPPAWILLLLAAIVFAVEFFLAVMEKQLLGVHLYWAALIDAGLLVSILSPVLYYAAYLPLTSRIDQLGGAYELSAENNRKMRALLDATAESLSLVGKNGVILAMNEEGAKRLGKTPAAIVGLNVYDLMPPDVAEKRKQWIDKLLSSKEPLSFEDERDGRRFANSLYPVFGGKGEVEKFAVYAADITARKKTELRYHLLFNNMLEGFAYCKMVTEGGRPSDFIYLEVNPAFEKLTGLKNVTGKKVSDVIPGIRESNPEMFEIYGRVASGGSPERFEAYVQALDIWFFVTVYCPEDGYFIAVFDNITERKLAEIGLRDKEELLRVLTASARDSIVVLNDRGEVVLWNQSSENMFGYPETEVLGREITGFIIPRRFRKFHTEGIGFFAGTGKGMAIGKTVEMTAEGKNGAEFPVELSLSSFQVKGNWHAVGIIRDITRRKEVEEKLIESEKSIRTLLDSSPVALILDVGIEADEKVEYINRKFTELFGYTIEDIPDVKKWWSLAYPDPRRREEIRAEWIKRVEIAVRDQSGIEPMEASITCKDGSIRYARVGFASVGTRNIVTFEDLTAQKRAEEEISGRNRELIGMMEELKSAQALLLRQEKLASIGTLSAGVAHEILNPLNIIGTIVQVMQMDEWPVKSEENLKEIMAQVKRATKITNNLRMFAHVHKRETTAVDLHDLFDKTVALLEHDFTLDNIFVERHYGKNIPLLFADQDLLAQVFLNILNNARHALQETADKRKKVITVKTINFEGGVEMSLSNNGPRIPENIIGKIFDPFFTTKDPNKGTGLGLSMAHTFIQEFGGAIRVENMAGEGVTFTISLPTGACPAGDLPGGETA